jgi:hypothetical protein
MQSDSNPVHRSGLRNFAIMWTVQLLSSSCGAGPVARNQSSVVEPREPGSAAPLEEVSSLAAAAVPPPQRWQKGSLHVHAAPSGDSRTAVVDVIAWYESRGYAFIALTDHNRVTQVAPGTDGKPYVRRSDKGLIVLAGVELTYNPDICVPAPPAEFAKKCRIHVNAIGVTTRPPDKLSWPDRSLTKREDIIGQAAAFAGANESSQLVLGHDRGCGCCVGRARRSAL